MPAPKKKQIIEIKDYEHEWINRLAVVLAATEKMEPEERAAALRYLKQRYSKEWPSDSY